MSGLTYGSGPGVPRRILAAFPMLGDDINPYAGATPERTGRGGGIGLALRASAAPQLSDDSRDDHADARRTAAPDFCPLVHEVTNAR